MLKENLSRGIFGFSLSTLVQHSFISRPSDSFASEDAGIEPKTAETWALAIGSSNHSAMSQPTLGYISSTRIYLIHKAISHPQGYISSTKGGWRKTLCGIRICTDQYRYRYFFRNGTRLVLVKDLRHCTRGGHRHMQVGRLADADLIPDIRSKGLNIVIFRTTEGKNWDLYIDQFWSVPNPISRDRIFHFQWKKIETYTLIFRNLLILLKISSMWFCFWAWETFLRRCGQLAQLATDVLPTPHPSPPRPPPPP